MDITLKATEIDVTLTRSDLALLLTKLNRPPSERTLYRIVDGTAVAVTATEDR